MTFQESPVCKDGRYCEVCRDLEGGRHWRDLMCRVYIQAVHVVDFVCHKDKPWVVPAVAKVQPALLGGLVMDKAGAVLNILGDNRLVMDIRQALTDGGPVSDCTHCARHKIKVALGRKALALDDATLAKVYAAIGLTDSK